MKFKLLLLAFQFFLIPLLCVSQEKPYEKLGRLILKSVVENDSILFKSLIIPEKAVAESLKKMYRKERSKEILDEVLSNLPETYRETVDKEFMLKYHLMVNKARIFNLDFKDINYEILKSSNRFDKEMGVTRIFATIDHPKFKYFSFGMIAYKGKQYLVDSRVDISEVNKYSERDFLNRVVLSEDDYGHVQSVGTIALASDKEDAEIMRCIIDNLFLVGVTDTYISEDSTSPSYLKGQWEFRYYVNDINDYIGSIGFHYEYKVEKGTLTYKFYKYYHDQDNSDYESVGALPMNYNKKIAEVFTRDEYYEMLYDTKINVRSAIKRLKRSVDKCH